MNKKTASHGRQDVFHSSPVPAMIRPQRLSPATSLILDIARFLAALTVAMGHFGQTIFSVGLPNLMSAGSGAVGLFFVLSGFIIRYITLYRPSRLSEYLADRASRLLSVTIPALGFTVFAELVSRHFDRLVAPATVGAYLLRVFATLTFTSETWFQDLTPYGNGPFWSLSFEAFYYVMYGVAFYLRGRKRIAVLFGVALLAGPSVLFLAPTWFLGAYLFDIYSRLLPSRRKSLLTVGALAGFAVIAAGTLVLLPHAYRAEAKTWSLSFNSYLMSLRMWKSSTWYYETGIAFGFVLLGTLLLFDRVVIPMNSRSVRFMRYVADGTFPLYLFHFPMLLLIRAVIPYDHASRWQLAMVFSSVVVVCILLAGLCNKLKDALRRLFLKQELTTRPPISLSTK